MQGVKNWRPRKPSGNGEEYESFVSKENKTVKRKAIPAPAKKSIVVACILTLLGLMCLSMFVASFIIDSDMNGGRWALPIVAIVSLGAGIHTLRLAWLIYKDTPGYYWSMIFA